MKTIVLCFILFSLGLNLFADEIGSGVLFNQSPYLNIRESNSRFINANNIDDVTKYYKGTKEMEALRIIISDKTVNTCGSKIIDKIKSQLSLETDDEVEMAILGLRLDNSIDDISADILLRTNKVFSHQVVPIASNNLTDEEEQKAISIYKEKSDDIKNEGLCLEDTYRVIISKLYASNFKFLKNLKHLNRVARKNNLISDKKFKNFEKFRLAKVHEWPLTLSEYASRLNEINKRFPERKKEEANFVTDVSSHQKVSLRQTLYGKYNSTQIILLANIVKDLKLRLDSKDITINIDYDGRPSEIIYLSPMEKFRFVLKLLRKELSVINNSSLLDGRPATFMDMIAASYEVGNISSNEILQFSSLHEIWDHTKTKKEKVLYWARTFGGIASVLLPPPYGFISVFAIMVIDQQTSDLSVDRDPDYNIF